MKSKEKLLHWQSASPSLFIYNGKCFLLIEFQCGFKNEFTSRFRAAYNDAYNSMENGKYEDYLCVCCVIAYVDIIVSQPKHNRYNLIRTEANSWGQTVGDDYHQWQSLRDMSALNLKLIDATALGSTMLHGLERVERGWWTGRRGGTGRLEHDSMELIEKFRFQRRRNFSLVWILCASGNMPLKILLWSILSL